MREYRGKSVLSIEELNAKEIPHKNGWVYGWYVDGWIVGNYADSNDEWIAFEWWSQVIPETVGQATGLTDKNGVEIYEGDIVLVRGEDDQGTIVWDLEELEYGIDMEDVQIKLGYFYGHDLEVTGNIHDQED